MTLSNQKLPFFLFCYHKYSKNPLKPKTFTKLVTLLGICCSLSTWTHAQLPPPVASALNQAKISTDDISLIIMPVNPVMSSNQSSAVLESKLPKVVNLTEDVLQQDTSTNADELPSGSDANVSNIVAPSKAVSSHITDNILKTIKQANTAIQANTVNLNNTDIQVSNASQTVSKPLPANQSTAANKSTAVDQSIKIQPLAFDNEPNSAVMSTIPSLEFPIRHLADIPRTPASTMKLIPTFIALDLLGPDFIWFTEVYHTGVISGNTLYGDLIIKGSGDPKLTEQRLNKLLEQVQKAGIRHIKGDIVLDSSVFQGVTKDSAAFDNDPLRPYNASADGFLINFNSLEVTTVALLNEGISRLYYKPKLADYDLPNTIANTAEGNCSSVKSSLSPVWQGSGLKFNKILPKSCGTHTFYLAYPDPKDFSKRVIKSQWLNLGNTLSGNIKFLGISNTVSGDMINTESPIKTIYGSYLNMGAGMNADIGKDIGTDMYADRSADLGIDKRLDKNVDKHVDKSDNKSIDKNIAIKTSLDKENALALAYSFLPSSPLPFVRYPSLPLSEQIYDINHYSNNVMAEQVTLSLPLYTKTLIKADALNAPPIVKISKSRQINQSDYLKSLATINQWWQSHLTTLPPVMTNGSGLCRDCTVTADNLAELLSFAYNHPNFNTYVNSLGVAGISGTIADHADRLPNSAAIGRAWIKTGTLNDVTSMAGYVHGKSGQDYVVVGIINGSKPEQPLNTYEARYVLDTMLDWTANQ
ncbi:D-alanyl-D-alanine carboxypeptidase [Psychrobacter sp.]|uniref:D-alanyl-D-alanine carboxypeptidase/D-alanyl-D-alanine-endopeptidase n=1 Tax=Psychrobacter sp. TaxID=56811 RepID=UPI0025DA5EC1|nr:D-alanyl-D-alanine carboxypeptidase [Psychrobacter sp.]